MKTPAPTYRMSTDDGGNVMITLDNKVIAQMAPILTPAQAKRHALMLSASLDMFGALSRAITAQPFESEAKWIEHAQRAMARARP